MLQRSASLTTVPHTHTGVQSGWTFLAVNWRNSLLGVLCLRTAVLLVTMAGILMTGAYFVGECVSPGIRTQPFFAIFWFLLFAFQLTGLVGIFHNNAERVQYILFAQELFFFSTILALVLTGLGSIEKGGAMGLVFAAVLMPPGWFIMSLTASYLHILRCGGNGTEYMNAQAVAAAREAQRAAFAGEHYAAMA
eukprot:GDKI01040332.1.p1 GENE.GDKI01040332.1~~GDKI01040332.1.p1  ORF type:complete len:221 (-),score=23.46 GDKI01040332.1:35-613(-)